TGVGGSRWNVGHGQGAVSALRRIETPVGRTRRMPRATRRGGWPSGNRIRWVGKECRPRPVAVSDLRRNETPVGRTRRSRGRRDEGDGPPGTGSGGSRWNVGHGRWPCPTYVGR